MMIEHLAGVMEPVTFEAGSWLMREGDYGDRYLLIDTGEADILRFGELIGRIGRETARAIALVHDLPRTASVRAVTSIGAFALGRDDFVEAVSGHAASSERAHSVVHERLAADEVREADPAEPALAAPVGYARLMEEGPSGRIELATIALRTALAEPAIRRLLIAGSP